MGVVEAGCKVKRSGMRWRSAASLPPDADLPTSKLGRALFWLSTRLEKRFGHRTITHSVIAIIALALLTFPLLLVNPIYFWYVVGGY